MLLTRPYFANQLADFDKISTQVNVFQGVESIFTHSRVKTVARNGTMAVLGTFWGDLGCHFCDLGFQFLKNLADFDKLSTKLKLTGLKDSKFDTPGSTR